LSTLYEILVINKSATSEQIKTAYRKLAKIYHPDKNQGNNDAEEKFKAIKDAYEVLSDPVKKKKYDLSLENNNYQRQQITKQKNYNDFTQEELKRRRYYQEFYANEFKKHKEKKALKEQKQYNETRTLIFLVPIALALVFFIINIYNHSTKENYKFQNPVSSKNNSVNIQTEILVKYKTGDEPYSYLIEKSFVDKLSNDVIILRNNLKSDAIIIVKDSSNKIIRHYYLEKNIEFFLEYLPQKKLNLSILSGDDFNCNIYEKVKVFCKNNLYYTYSDPIQINNDYMDSVFINFNESIISKRFKLTNDSIYYNSFNIN